MKNIFVLALSVLMIASCSTSNEVASNKLFQKRKYTKGWNVNSSRKVEVSKRDHHQEIASASKESAVETKENISVENALSDGSSVAHQKASWDIDETASQVFLVEEESPIVALANSEPNISHFYTNNQLMNHSDGVEESKQIMSEEKKEPNSSSNDDMLILLYLFAIILPFVAVGIVTDWDLTVVLINILLMFLCVIPGIIHAFITIRDYY